LMLMKAAVLASLFLIMLVLPITALDGSMVIRTSQTGYPDYGDGYDDGYGNGYAEYGSEYSGSMQTGSSVPYPSTGSQGQYSDSLAMYQEFYDMGQGTQSTTATAPTQFQIYGAEPTYLIINGQSTPYNPAYVPTNSFWIQGRTSWTQYMKCPLNARFRMLAYSQGGPTTVVEEYPNGYQMVKQYYFYRGYTQLMFWADMVGRHTLKFYNNGQPSNPVIVDVLPYTTSGYSGYSGYPGYTGYGAPYGGQTTGVIKTTITYTGQTTGQPKGKQGIPQTGTGAQDGSPCQCNDGRSGFMRCDYFGCRCNCSEGFGHQSGDYNDPFGIPGGILVDPADDGSGNGIPI
jgi:hypothetical protein